MEKYLLVDRDYIDVKNAYKEVFQKKEGTLEDLVNLFCKTISVNNNEKIINFFKRKFDVMVRLMIWHVK